MPFSFKPSLAFSALALSLALQLALPAPALAEEAPPEAMPALALSSSADAAKVLVAYSGTNAQAELTSPAGVHVYFDVYRPSALSTKPGPNDILCISHSHYDHRNLPFDKNFPGRKIDMEAGEFRSGDLRVLCIPSAHDPSQAIGPGTSNNYLFLVETGGLRILHTGDIGQLAYSEEQLAAIGGRVDLLFQQFENSYSYMSAQNGVGFALLAQLKPRLVIPTHSSPAATRRLLAEYPTLFSEAPTVELSPSALPDATAVLFTGDSAKEAWRLHGATGAAP
jgi:hypothetical protein